MKYIGLQEQISRNNRRSFLLLLAFPGLIFLGVYLLLYFVNNQRFDAANENFLYTIPWVSIGVVIWFLIAFASHGAMIRMATKSKTLERKENMRVYNLTENLCMSIGMKMPKLNIIESDALNAFASGINEKSYTVTLTRGIMEKLDDKELEGVIAHELTHIRNKDVRLLIISIIFVGIFGFAVEMILRSMLYGSGRRRGKDNKVDGRVMLIALVIAVLVYVLSILFKFALSRRREYMADAGAVELTKDSQAMASALRKISGNSEVEVRSGEVKEMFIENAAKGKGPMAGLRGLFATHPPIQKRIEFLENM